MDTGGLWALPQHNKNFIIIFICKICLKYTETIDDHVLIHNAISEVLAGLLKSTYAIKLIYISNKMAWCLLSNDVRLNTVPGI